MLCEAFLKNIKILLYVGLAKIALRFKLFFETT